MSSELCVRAKKVRLLRVCTWHTGATARGGQALVSGREAVEPDYLDYGPVSAVVMT